jgi:hypothetical protein
MPAGGQYRPGGVSAPYRSDEPWFTLAKVALVSDNAAADRFSWRSYDLASALPAHWQRSILDLVGRELKTKMISPGSITSRERSQEIELPTHIVESVKVARDLPWLQNLYNGLFRDLAQRLTQERVYAANRAHHGARIQVQRGSDERYECHVDTCPITGLLYVTDHPPGAGGELVVANSGDVKGQEEVDRDATRIHPVAGHLIFLDARSHTHYVAPLKDPDAIRVVVPMTFFTPSCSEGMRPSDLDRHLGLE